MHALATTTLTLTITLMLMGSPTIVSPALAETPAQTMEKNEAEAAQVRQMHTDILGMYRRAHELIQQVRPEDKASLATLDKAIKSLTSPVITDGLQSPDLARDAVFREVVKKNLRYMKLNVQPSLEQLEAAAKTFKQPIKPATPEDFKTP